MQSSILKLLEGIPVNAVLRERIKQYESDMLRTADEKCQLEKKLADLEKKLSELENEYIEYRRSHEQFVEIKGMKFKYLGLGSYSETPCCIKCHDAPPMSYYPDMFGGIAVCDSCHHKVQIQPHELQAILKKLNSSTEKE